MERTQHFPRSDALEQLMPNLRTYIVEDSAVIRENLVATLEELVPVTVVGFAEDEATAVDWLRQPGNDCQLGIVDIFLKKGSGLGVLQALRSSDKRLKLVVLSNYATPDMRRKCIELGADKVFDKSNEIDALIRYCERLAAGRPDAPDSAPGTLS
jgi:DNA-binding NarL/FixJ family response regulator